MKLTGYYTTAGEKIAAGLLAGATLSVTHITAGSGSTALSAAALAQEQQDLGPCEPEVSGTTAVLRCTLSSDQASAPYFIRELGVYALDSAGKDTLYLILRLDEEVSINPAFRLVLRFNLEQTLSDGAGVEVTAPLAGLATQEELKTKADLVGGQVPYAQTPHLIKNATLYVDAALGSDANPGTQEAPFKTIQAAVNSLPRDLGTSSVNIYVADGSYQEDVFISGFTGGTGYRPFVLKSASGSNTGVEIQSVSINNCSTTVRMQDLSFIGGLQETTSTVGISSARVELVNLMVKKAGNKTTGISVGANGFSQANISGCVVDGYDEGISSIRASVASVVATTVKNCAAGLKCYSSGGYAGIIMAHNMTYQNNTANTQSGYNGQIFGGE